MDKKGWFRPIWCPVGDIRLEAHSNVNLYISSNCIWVTIQILLLTFTLAMKFMLPHSIEISNHELNWSHDLLQSDFHCDNFDCSRKFRNATHCWCCHPAANSDTIHCYSVPQVSVLAELPGLDAGRVSLTIRVSAIETTVTCQGK